MLNTLNFKNLIQFLTKNSIHNAESKFKSLFKKDYLVDFNKPGNYLIFLNLNDYPINFQKDIQLLRKHFYTIITKEKNRDVLIIEYED